MEVRLAPGQLSIGRADSCDVALPGERISRLHCLLRGRGERWEIIDRSRHGVTLDGQRVTGRAEVTDGSVLGMDPYRIEVSLRHRDPDPTAIQPDHSHEPIVAHDAGALRVERAVLVVVAGPDAGRRFTLKSRRVSVGAAGSRLVLSDPGLVPNQVHVRISRGRVMLEPGAGAAWLDGDRVRDVTPLYADEDFRIADTVLRVERRPVDERPTARRFGDMVGQGRVMTEIFGKLRRMSGYHFALMVIGESGTGKELAARAIHAHSPRAEHPFIALNCAAISDSLLESELFGHEKGAFTGAARRRDGAFHEADGGTLFLDEIGELPLTAQAKLLRVLATGEVRRVGAMNVSHPDVRIVAATNRDLAAMVADGEFRADLFYRLAELHVRLPPLRERPADLEVLCQTLCAKLHPEAHVTEAALTTLARHSWPGNIRELRNVLLRAFVAAGPRIDTPHLSFHQLERSAGPVPVGRTLEANERSYLANIMQQHGGNRSAAARELGIARSTLQYKLKKYGLA